MSAHAACAPGASVPQPVCPLPLPEHLRGSAFASCLAVAAPLIHASRDRVRRAAERLAREFPGAPFDPTRAEESLAANLAEPLLIMAVKTMVLELNVARLEGVLTGDTPEERFASFLTRLEKPEVADSLFAEYPVLRRA